MYHVSGDILNWYYILSAVLLSYTNVLKIKWLLLFEDCDSDACCLLNLLPQLQIQIWSRHWWKGDSRIIEGMVFFCHSIHQKPDNLTYFFVAGSWHWRFIRGLCGGHPGFRRYPNTSLQVMHNGNILYTVSQRCQCWSVILWLGRHPASESAV